MPVVYLRRFASFCHGMKLICYCRTHSAPLLNIYLSPHETCSWLGIPLLVVPHPPSHSCIPIFTSDISPTVPDVRKDTDLAEEPSEEGGLAKRRDWVAIGTTHDKAQAVTFVCDAWADGHDEVCVCGCVCGLCGVCVWMWMWM